MGFLPVTVEPVSFTLTEHGDGIERQYWPLFLRDEFPSYEKFWADCIVPLTLLPESVAFKSDVGLAKIGRSPEDIGNAQLHYTTFIHLVRVFDLRQDRFYSTDAFVEALVRLAAATDVADELLERATKPGRAASRTPRTASHDRPKSRARPSARTDLP
jgi:hypothetical protein